jgi:hypothetical protein
MLFLPRAVAYGYLPTWSMNLVPVLLLVDGPVVLSLYAVLLLSGWISWNGSVIGEGRQSRECFFRYVLILVFSAALTGLAILVSGLFKSEFASTTYVAAGGTFLLALLVALWFPKYGVLRQRLEYFDRG